MSALTRALIAPIRWYQRLISPMRPRTCRFHPTCSAYAVTALEVHGPFVGSWLAIRRIGRCHPWTPGGVDQVPPKGQWRSIKPPYDPRSRDGADDSSADGGRGDEQAHRHDDDPDATTAQTATRWRAALSGPSSLLPAIRSCSVVDVESAVRRATNAYSFAPTFITTARRQGA